MTSPRFIPLRLLLATLDGSPGAAYGGDGVLDRIGIADYELGQDADGIRAGLQLAFDDEVGVTLPGSDDLGLFVGSVGGTTMLEVSVVLTEPGPHLTFGGLDVSLRVPSGILTPALWSGDRWVKTDAVLDVPLVGVDVIIAPTGEVEVTEGGGGAPSLSLPPVMIGDTGVVVEAASIALHLGMDNQAALPADAPPGFRGLHLSGVRVHLPDTLGAILPSGITCADCYVGAGGFTGGVNFDWATDAQAGDDPEGELGGLGFRLESVELAFAQNVPTAAAIAGTLTLPFLESDVEVSVAVGADGTLAAALSDADGDLLTVGVDPLGDVRLAGVGFEADDDGPWAVVLTGTLLPEIGAPAVAWPEIAIDELRIDSTGRVELAGGWLDLSAPIAVDLYGFVLEITRLGFGNDDGWRWLGLSGGVRLVEILPAGVSAEGLRLRWNDAGQTDLTLEGVGIELTVPNAFHLAGSVAMGDDGFGGRAFRGDIELELTSLGVSVDAAVVIGRNPATGSYFMGSVFLELPVGIPLWATGTALFGFGGMLALDMGPAVVDDEWYEWFSTSPAPFDLTDPAKWQPEAGVTAVGAGVVIGTIFDTGWAVSTKSVIAVLLPGPTVLVSGQADILNVKPDLTGGAEGTFSSLLVIDGAGGTLTLDIGAQWSVAKVIDIAGSAGGFFDFTDPSRWRVNLGEPEPPSERIRADVIALFSGDAYLVADNDGLITGFAVQFGDSWKFGPVRVTLTSWITASAGVSWSPIQFMGELALGGEYSISVAGIGLGIAAEATLGGQAPSRYEVAGTLRIVVKLPTPIKDLDARVELSWEEPATPPFTDPWGGVSLVHDRVTETWEGAASSSGSVADADGPLVPVDAQPVLVFERSVADGAGLDPANDHHPGPFTVGEHRIEHDVRSVVLEQWSKVDGADGWVAADVELSGVWQLVEDDQGRLVNTRLTLGALTPFDFSRAGSRIYADALLAAHSLPCGDAPEPVELCLRADAFPLGASFSGGFTRDGTQILLPWPTEIEVIEREALCDSTVALHATFATDEYVNAHVWAGPPEPINEVRVCIEVFIDPVEIRVWRQGSVIASTTVAPDHRGEVALLCPGGEWVEIQGRTYDIAYLCATTEASVAAVGTYLDRGTFLDQLALSWSQEQPILRPETRYRLTVETGCERTRGATSDEQTWTHHAYFHTGGPPGVTPTWEVGAGDDTYPAGGPLASLEPYVSAMVPAPDAPAQFGSYGIGVSFEALSVDAMYGADLFLQVRDRNGDLVTDEEGRPLRLANRWSSQPTLTLSTHQLSYAAGLADCRGEPIDPGPRPSLLLPVGAVLLEEWSTSDALDRWVATLGAAGAQWQVLGDELVQPASVTTAGSGDAIRSGAVLVADGVDEAEVEIEVELSFSSRQVGVVFRSVDDANFCRFRMAANGRRWVEEIVGGVATVLWSGRGPSPAGPRLHLGIQVAPDRLRVMLEGELLCDLRGEEAGSGEPSGTVGLYTYGATGLAVDRVAVSRWPGGWLAPQSRYEAELVGACWLYEAERSDPLPDDWHDEGGGLRTVGLQEAWSDVQLQVELGASAAAGPAAAVVRHRPNGDHYRFELDPVATTRSIIARVGGVDHVLWSDGDYQPGDVLALDVTVGGATVTVAANFAPVAALTVPPGQRVTGSGRVGVLAADHGLATARNLFVWGGPDTVVHRWPFTTSAAPSLVGLFDTYRGHPYQEEVAEPVDYAQQVAEAGEELGELALAVEAARGGVDVASGLTLDQAIAEARQATEAKQEGHGRWFDTIMGALDLGYRPHPPVVEVSSLRTASRQRLALLVESPEPLPWERFTVTAAYGRNRGVPVDDLIVIPSRDGTRALLIDGEEQGWRAKPGAVTIRMDLDLGPALPRWTRGLSTQPEVVELAFEWR